MLLAGGVDLTIVWRAHNRDRVKKDKHNVMTMVMMKAAPSHRSRILDDSTVVALDKVGDCQACARVNAVRC